MQISFIGKNDLAQIGSQNTRPTLGVGVTCHRSADQLLNSQEKKTWHSM
jgi:hypothetical protein